MSPDSELPEAKRFIQNRSPWGILLWAGVEAGASKFSLHPVFLQITIKMSTSALLAGFCRSFPLFRSYYNLQPLFVQIWELSPVQLKNYFTTYVKVGYIDEKTEKPGTMMLGFVIRRLFVICGQVHKTILQFTNFSFTICKPLSDSNVTVLHDFGPWR